MKIVSWNVNGIRACAKKGLFEYLEAEDFDIMCLQETKAHPDQLNPEFARPWGRLSYWSAAARPGYSGTVSYLKKEPKEVSHGMGLRKFDTEGRFVITDHDDFLLYNVYFPNGGSGPERHQYKQEFLSHFLQHLLRQKKLGREIIVVGDYNIAYLDIDVYDPLKLSGESGFLPEERKWFREFIDAGFVDSFRHFHPKETNAYTWWNMIDRSRVSNRGWRIDHICVTEGLIKKIREVKIESDREGSDHCPIMINLS